MHFYVEYLRCTGECFVQRYEETKRTEENEIKLNG